CVVLRGWGARRGRQHARGSENRVRAETLDRNQPFRRECWISGSLAPPSYTDPNILCSPAHGRNPKEPHASGTKPVDRVGVDDDERSLSLLFLRGCGLPLVLVRTHKPLKPNRFV